MSIWQEYRLRLSFTGGVMGGIPKHPDIIQSWLEARAASGTALAKIENPTPLADLAEQVAAEVHAAAVQENKVWCGFKSDDLGLYVDGFHLKSHLKDCANIMQASSGIRNLKAKLADRVYVVEPRLHFAINGHHVTEPDGYWEHPVHVMTMQGPRSALKRSDYVEKSVITATLRVLGDGVISEELLRSVLEYGSIHGFGAERGLGNGRYEWKLEALQTRDEVARSEGET